MKTHVASATAAITLLIASSAFASAWFKNQLDQKGIPDVSVTITNPNPADKSADAAAKPPAP